MAPGSYALTRHRVCVLCSTESTVPVRFPGVRFPSVRFPGVRFPGVRFPGGRAQLHVGHPTPLRARGMPRSARGSPASDSAGPGWG